mmetsp:Transcript_53299/g.125214  ORF Transcript_53299/g.125214 Transcript_53299/m.125214 type:complete len:310 (-) Transcript_53299:519-1448(-)
MAAAGKVTASHADDGKTASPAGRPLGRLFAVHRLRRDAERLCGAGAGTGRCLCRPGVRHRGAGEPRARTGVDDDRAAPHAGRQRGRADGAAVLDAPAAARDCAVLHDRRLLRPAAADGRGSHRHWGGELRRLARPVARLLRREGPGGAGPGLDQSATDFLTLVGLRFLARLISPPWVTRSLPITLTLLTCGRALPLFENLTILTTRGPGMASSRSALAFSGMGRHSTSSLPMCWMGAAFSSSQSWANIASRAVRSSPSTRTLMSPCDFSAASVSFTTAGVRPSPPIITTGSRWWASARFSLRWAGVRLI